VENLRRMRDFVQGVSPWDRVEAFDLVASHVLGVEKGVTSRAIAEVSGQVEGGSVSSLIESLFSPQASAPLRGDSETYDDSSNSFVHQVVERGRGIPLSLAVIGSEVASRRGLTMNVIGMPGHVLVQDGADPARFFDVFHGGVELDVAGCRSLYHRLTGLSDWNPDFLAPIGTAQQIFRMLNNLKSIYRRRSDVAHLRKVMSLRALFPGVEAAERGEFARLMRETN
jgi:regulator of sirC expression with transglutaminase-like and TPR domain